MTKQDIEEVNDEIGKLKRLLNNEAEAVEKRVGLYHNKIEEVVSRTISVLLG